MHLLFINKLIFLLHFLKVHIQNKFNCNPHFIKENLLIYFLFAFNFKITASKQFIE
jgi:hypothetical protein